MCVTTAEGSSIPKGTISKRVRYVERGRLRRVLPESGIPSGGLWAVYPSKHHLSPKVRAFVDFIDESLAPWRVVPRARALPSKRAAHEGNEG